MAPTPPLSPRDYPPEDPWNFSVDQVVAVLAPSESPADTGLAKILRENDVSGTPLLLHINNETLRDDLGVSGFGRRCAIVDVVDDLRWQSRTYQERHLEELRRNRQRELQLAATTPLPGSDEEDEEELGIKPMMYDTNPLAGNKRKRGAMVIERSPPPRPLELFNAESPLLMRAPWSTSASNGEDIVMKVENGEIVPMVSTRRLVIPDSFSSDGTLRHEQDQDQTKQSDEAMEDDQTADEQTAGKQTADEHALENEQPAERVPVIDEATGKKRLAPTLITVSHRDPELSSAAESDTESGSATLPSTPITTPSPGTPGASISRQKQKPHYMSMKAHSVNSVFYDVDPGDEIEYESPNEFIMAATLMPPGDSRYVYRHLSRFLQGRVQEVRWSDNGLLRIARKPSVSTWLLKPHEHESFTVYKLDKLEHVQSARHETSATLDIAWPSARQSKMTGRDTEIVYFNEPPKTLQPNDVFINALTKKGDEVQDYDHLQKWKYVDGGEEVLPAYGDSGSENEMSVLNWCEVQEELGQIEKMQPRSRLLALSKKDMLAALDELIDELVEKWAAKKRPDEAAAYKVWRRAVKERSRRVKKIMAEEDIKRLDARLDKQKKEISEGASIWHKKDILKKSVTGNLEVTVFEREDKRWIISLMERKKYDRPPSSSAAVRKTAQRANGEHVPSSEDDSGDESLGDAEDEDEEDEEDEDDGLDGFISHDDEPMAASPLGEDDGRLVDIQDSDVEDEDEEVATKRPQNKATDLSKRRTPSDHFPTTRPDSTPMDISEEEPELEPTTTVLTDAKIKDEMPNSIIGAPTPGQNHTIDLTTPSPPRKQSKFKTPRIIDLVDDSDMENVEPSDNSTQPPQPPATAPDKPRRSNMPLPPQPRASASEPRRRSNMPLPPQPTFERRVDHKRRPGLQKANAGISTAPPSGTRFRDPGKPLQAFLDGMDDGLRYAVKDRVEEYVERKETLLKIVLGVARILHEKRKGWFSQADSQNRKVNRAITKAYYLYSKYGLAYGGGQLSEDDLKRLDNPTRFSEFVNIILKFLDVDGQGASDDSERSGSKRARRSSTEDEDFETPSQRRKRARPDPKQDLTAKANREDAKKIQKALERRIKMQRKRAVPAGKIMINVGRFAKYDDIYLHDDLAQRLKPHQVEGIQFLWQQLVLNSLQAGKNTGALLAHTMGLGKTAQVIAFLYTLATAGGSSIERVYSQVPEELRKSRSLILVPAGLVENWYEEFFNWVPLKEGVDRVGQLHQGILDLTHLGDIRLCSSIESDKEKRVKELRDWYKFGGVLIMGYSIFRNFMSPTEKSNLSPEEREELRDMLREGPRIIIADEAHVLKNVDNSHKLSAYAREFKSSSRIALTGSPLTNYLMEYWAMIDWIDPNYLGPKKEFKDMYVVPIEAGLWADSEPMERKAMQKKLHLLKQFVDVKMQRKNVEAIKEALPQKTEFLVKLPLTELQIKMYCRYLEKSDWEKRLGLGGRGIVNRIVLFELIDCLNLIVNHPHAFIIGLERKRNRKYKEKAKANVRIEELGVELDGALEDEPAIGAEDPITEEVEAEVNDASTQSGENYNWAKEMVDEYAAAHPDESYVEQSYRVKALVKIVQESAKAQDKLLIFSHSIPTLDFLQELLSGLGHKFERLDGGTPMNTRQAATKKFNSGTQSSDIFLISTKAGGLGVNLQGASRVILFDFKWTPALEEQAVGRAYRLGQTKDVFVYRLISTGTFEDSMKNLARFKSNLSTRVVDQKDQQRTATKNLREYLKLPTNPEKEDLGKFLGKDVILDELLKDSYTCAIELSETFEPDVDPKLTKEEIANLEVYAENARRCQVDPEFAEKCRREGIQEELLNRAEITEQRSLMLESALKVAETAGAAAISKTTGIDEAKIAEVMPYAVKKTAGYVAGQTGRVGAVLSGLANKSGFGNLGLGRLPNPAGSSTATHPRPSSNSPPKPGWSAPPISTNASSSLPKLPGTPVVNDGKNKFFGSLGSLPKIPPSNNTSNSATGSTSEGSGSEGK